MAFLGNLIWFTLGGWLLGTLYLLGAIILFPLLPFLLPMVSYSYWPFGRRPVSKKAVVAYKTENNMLDFPDFTRHLLAWKNSLLQTALEKHL